VRPKAYSYLRMSTDIQLKGHSRRRQLDASKAYAEAEGLELADDAQLEDIGISAFRGANVRDGALGRFLAAVKAGSVERGSYLLVESLDRLSREEILVAQPYRSMDRQCDIAASNLNRSGTEHSYRVGSVGYLV